MRDRPHRDSILPRLTRGALLVALLALAGCGRGGQAPTFHTPSANEVAQSGAAQRLRAGAAGANLIIILLDAACADHFSSFGYPWRTTPNIDRFFGEGIVLTEAYAAAPSTKPSVTALFTSQFPDTHGTLSVDYPMTRNGATLAECLRAAGYTTAAFVASPAVAECFGFGRGFQSFDEVFRQAGAHPVGGRYPHDMGQMPVDGALLVEAAAKWMESHRDERFFTYLHCREPHTPYGAPRRFTANITGPPRHRWLPAVDYDRGLAYADSLVAQLLGELRALDLLDRSVIVLLADHGEAFGEHHLSGHETTVYREMVHVPVAFHLPSRCGATPRRRREVFCLTDVMPTLLDLFRLPPPATMQGRSRLALLAGEEERTPAMAVSRAFADDRSGGKRKPQSVSYALRVPEYTLILADRGRRVELYDRARDPGEKHNLAGRRAETVDALRAVFTAWAGTQRFRPVVLPGGRAPAPREAKMDDEVRRQLKALGYLK